MAAVGSSARPNFMITVVISPGIIRTVSFHPNPLGGVVGIHPCLRSGSTRRLPACYPAGVGMSTSRFRRLLIGLATLTLFVVGPLAGSVDDDGDGSPDIPVVVSVPVLFTDRSADSGVDQRSGSIHDGAPSGHLRSATPGRPIIDSPFSSVDAGSVFDWCCSLRC